MNPVEKQKQAAARHPKLVGYLCALPPDEREDHLLRIAHCLNLGLREQLTEVNDVEDFALIATGLRAGVLPH